MNSTPTLRDLAPIFARRLAAILAALSSLIAARFLKHPRLARLIVPLCTRINRTAQRAAILLARIAPGPAPARRQSRPDPRRNRQRAPSIALPRAQSWLIRALPNEAAAFAGQLEHLLAEPEIAALLAANPRLARLLAPLRRALSTDQPHTPPRPRHQPPPAPPTPETLATLWPFRTPPPGFKFA